MDRKTGRETERKTGRERGETEREEDSRNSTDDHKGKGTKQEEVTDFGTHGEYFNHCKWQVWGPWGFTGILLFPFSAPKGKGSTSYNVMPG